MLSVSTATTTRSYKMLVYLTQLSCTPLWNKVDCVYQKLIMLSVYISLFLFLFVVKSNCCDNFFFCGFHNLRVASRNQSVHWFDFFFSLFFPVYFVGLYDGRIFHTIRIARYCHQIRIIKTYREKKLKQK